MNKKLGILGLAIVGILLTSGLGLALADGAGPMNQMAVSDEDGVPNGQDKGYERLEMLQERFNLTDNQIEEIRTEVTSMINEGSDRTEIRDTVMNKLQEFGVELPDEMGIGLGPQRSSESRVEDREEHRGQGFGRGPHHNGEFSMNQERGSRQGKGMGNHPYTESE